jgi:prepilin-type N-terminal cleavage/methylation domain-containing protein
MHTRSSHSGKGFTLIEMAIVLVIVGAAAAMVLKASGGMLDAEKRKSARIRLDTVDTALANFVAIHKRLPCPANGTIATGLPNAGIETLSPAGTCNPITQQFGVLPWITLGLSENDASDPWEGRLTYRVDPALAGSAPLPLLMNMSNCDPSATGPTGPGGSCISPTSPCTGSVSCTSPTSFLVGKGLDVWDGRNGAAGWAARQNNRTTGTGAAYVLISNGPGGTGAYGHNGGLQPGSVAINPDDEQPNVNNQVLALPATQVNTYRDALLNENQALRPTPPGPPQPAQTLTHFDDYLSHPTIMSVLNRANLGPRAH